MVENIPVLLKDLNKVPGAFANGIQSLNTVRAAAADEFRRMGIPHAKHEEWKYFNLSPLNKIDFRLQDNNSLIENINYSRFQYSGANACYVVVENGAYSKEKSDLKKLPAGVTIGSLSDLGSDPRVVKHFAQHADDEAQPFVALNTATALNGIVIIVDDKIKSTVPVQVIYFNDAPFNATMISLRTLVIAGDQSECTISESYHSSANSKPLFINAVSEVIAGKNARIHYSKLQVESDNTYHINYHGVNQAKDSYQHITTLSLGGSMLRNNLHIRLDDKNCETHLNGLYVLDGTQVMDNHTMVDHAMPECFSNELYKGIIAGKAQGVFNGKIMVRKDAQKTNAYQSNKNILLSDDASMFAKPQLEIFADDVKCSHGATTGQLDEEALFYLRARGIGENEARALLNHAFAAAVIEEVESEPLKESLMLLLSQKLRENA